MTRRQRLRRVTLLCYHALRNLAYYRTGWAAERELVFDDEFWRTVNANFLDICVLEWCKLFGDPRGKHYWRKAVSDHNTFLRGLLTSLNASQAEFDSYVGEMKTYRDKFVAHLDSEPVMNIPRLTFAEKSLCYLHEYVRAHEDEGSFFVGLSFEAPSYYRQSLIEGRAVYQSRRRAR